MVLVAFLDLDDSSVKPTVNMSNSDVADEIVTKVRSTLREEMPSYMVLELFISTVPIPRTMSSKIDRKKLRSFVASLNHAAATQYRYLDDTSLEQSVILESVAL
jgi:acyl-coenzyme A synthetase/AMP-(fatty) acid ligase